MGLRSTLKKAAVTAFRAAGDVPVGVTYIATVTDEADYNADTGVPALDGTAYTGLEFVFADYSSREIEDNPNVLEEDQQALIPVLTLPVTPAVGHRIHKSATDQWKVVDVQTDPAEALWVLQIRKTGVLTFA